MSLFVRSRVMLVLLGTIGLIAGGAIPSGAAKNDPCRVGCKTQKQGCRETYKAAFQASKANCTGSGKVKRECVRTARSVLRVVTKACRRFADDCLDCCKAGGTNCNVHCGDGVVSVGESCDPPGSSGCGSDGVCSEGCQCPPGSTTTTTTLTVTTSVPSTTTIASTTTTTTTSTTTTTQPPPCSNGVKDGNETAVDCGGGTCAPCADGLACTTGTDCLSKFCSGDVCTDPCPTEPTGTPCADDGNACTVDACADSTCQHTPAESGTICRPAAGSCDLAEECDGSGEPCPADQLAPGGEICRALQGTCDEEETCDGSSPQCPSDTFRRAGAGCRVPFGVCDQAEFCTGTSPACPANELLPSSTVCRPAAGECDQEETCTGSSKDCPDDAFDSAGRVCRAATLPCEFDSICGGQDPDCVPNLAKPQGTLCGGPRNGDCDLADACDGVSHDCPDVLMPPSEACRPAAGECDITEFCTGTGKACPADQLASGTLCRVAQFPCDADAFCTGADAECPLNPRKPQGAVCRTKSDACDIEDTCSGMSSNCPDVLEPPGKVCRPKDGVCDVEDTCSGSSPACPDVVEPSTTVCRASAGTCDVTETCDGSSHQCGPDGRVVGVCRASAGACDPAESCQTNSVNCPPDALSPGGTVCRARVQPSCKQDDVCNGVHTFCPLTLIAPRPAGAVCRPADGPCDAAETCDGLSEVCPSDAFASPTTVCRPADGVCDADDYCTGLGRLCPFTDDKKPAFTVCRAAAAPCDREEKCNGISDACPADGVQAAGIVCRPPEGIGPNGNVGKACDMPEVCDGVTTTCPADQNLPLGTVCSDGTECRTQGVCKGRCGGGLIGAACTSDADCAVGVMCLPFGPPQIYACASTSLNEDGLCDNNQGACESGTCTSRDKLFDQACDGDDFFINGDPNKRFCGDDPNHARNLICCAGSAPATAGQEGACRECCNDDVDEFNGGCPQNDIGSMQCCSGECKDIGSDPHNCGECGNDCFLNVCPSGSCDHIDCLRGSILDGECFLASSNCGVQCGAPSSSGELTEGVCFYDTPCSEGKLCVPEITTEDAHPNLTDCEQYRDCANYPVPPGGMCQFRFNALNQFVPLDITCPLLAQPETCVVPAPSNHCGKCLDDSDCFDPDVCLSTCAQTGAGAGPRFCVDGGLCARDLDECR